jgi:hypothetical protein
VGANSKHNTLVGSHQIEPMLLERFLVAFYASLFDFSAFISQATWIKKAATAFINISITNTQSSSAK